MNLKAFIAALMIATSACNALLGPSHSNPTTADAGVPTFYLNLPTPTPIPPTVVLPTFPVKGPTPSRTPRPPATPTSTPTSTPSVRWPVATLTIVSSMPMSGSVSITPRAFVNAEQLRLEQAGYKACGGKYALAFKPLDDASFYAAGMDTSLETQNARWAAADPSVIAYIGGYDSNAAKIAIPILNRAGPLLMMSPSATYPGLTEPVIGQPDEPDKYYPAGVRNFARVIPTDGVQGVISAAYMSKTLGVTSVFILDDGEPYGQAVADVFESAAKVLSIHVVGHESINPVAGDYQALMLEIATRNNGGPPDAIFASMLASNNASQLLKDKVTVLGDNTKVKFMGPGGIRTQSFIVEAGSPTAEGVFAADEGLPFPDGLTDAGVRFVNDYQAVNGKLTKPAALYAYETMNVLLKAIENVCASGGDPTDRRQVRDAVFAINNFSGVLGTWTFDQNGDTSLTNITIYTVKNGAWQVVETVR
jgi:branched-chain amino acid transport system substrate-binding protein